MEEKVYIKTPDSFVLAGIISWPPNARSVVVFCHGIDSHKEEYLDMFTELAQLLAADRVASIRFDFRGHGESSGSSNDFDVVGQVIDLDTVVRWLKIKMGVVALPIGFLGVSFGAAPGILWSASRGAFHKMCMFAPVLSYTTAFLEPETEWGKSNFNPVAFAHANSFGYLLLNGTFHVSVRLLEQMRLFKPLDEIGRISADLLIIHGTADALVPCHVTAEVGARYPSAKVRIVEGMDHGLFVAGDEEGKSPDSTALRRNLMNLICEHFNEQ